MVKISEFKWIVSEDGLETDQLEEISFFRNVKEGLEEESAILLDEEGNYYKLTDNKIFASKSSEDISNNPRGKGHWIMPSQIKSK